MEEKRGPIEKGEKGWPINPLGVVALLIIAAVIIFFILLPLARQKAPQKPFVNAYLTSPKAGEIVKDKTLTVELAVDQPEKVTKVVFWAKAYVDSDWQQIGEVKSAPFRLDWQIPDSMRNKAIIITSHIYGDSDKILRDPGGWREGIIILNP